MAETEGVPAAAESIEKLLTPEPTPPKVEDAPKPVLEGDDAPAPGDPASGDGDESPPEPLEVIEPPSSWKAEDKAFFKTLPLEAQKIVASREAERETAVSQRLQEAATKRSEAEAERKAVLDGRTQLIQQQDAALRTLFPELEHISQIDWQALAASDPAEYVKHKAQADALQMKIAQIQGYQRQLQTAQAEDFQKLAKERATSERLKLAAALPVFADPVKGRETATKLNDYLRSQGYTDDEINGISDHRTIKVIYKAWLADQTEAARKAAAAKQTQVAPKVVKPGTTPDADERSQKALAGSLGAHKKHGTVQSAASFLEKIL